MMNEIEMITANIGFSAVKSALSHAVVESFFLVFVYPGCKSGIHQALDAITNKLMN